MSQNLRLELAIIYCNVISGTVAWTLQPEEVLRWMQELHERNVMNELLLAKPLMDIW